MSGAYANAASFDFAVAWENDPNLQSTVLGAAVLLDPSVSDEVVGAWVLGIVTGLRSLSDALAAQLGHVDLLEVDRAELGGVIRDALRDGAYTPQPGSPLERAAARWSA